MQEHPDIDEIARQLAGNLSADELRQKWERGVVYLGEPVEPTQGQRQSLSDYVQKIRNDAPVFSAPVRMRTFEPERMKYEEARRKFWAVLQFRAAAIETLTEKPFVWEFDEAEQYNIQNLLRYFINDPECKYPLSKGIFVYGAVGTGKTEIMQAFCKFCEAHDLKKSFKLTSMSAVHIEAKTNKDFDPIAENIMYDRLFDEFGRHTGAVIRFGDALDINEAIIEFRYERWKRYGQLSHFIANATPNDLETLFSPMIFDRLREMCTSVLFPGKSKRI